MRLRRTPKHENSLKGDRKGRPYNIGYLFVGADLCVCPPHVPVRFQTQSNLTGRVMLRAVKSAGLRPKTGLKPSGNGFLLCMVSTTESQHHNKLNPRP